MINFKTPELSDRAAAANAVADSGYTGSDASFANIFLLRKKYGTQGSYSAITMGLEAVAGTPFR